MGLLEKLFGNNQRAADTNAPAQPTAPPAPSPTPEGPVPARRERTKPGTLPAGTQPADASPVDVPPPPTDGENAVLLNAIAAIVASDDADSRAALYAAILAADFYLVSMAPEGDDDSDIGTGEVTLQEGQQLSLATIRDPEGRTFLPAFTDVERLSRSLPDRGRYIRINAPAVCRMFLQGGGEGIVINPSQPPSGVITRAEAELLAAGVVPRIDDDGQLQGQVERQMRLAIAKPDRPPADSFVAAIRAEAARQPIVNEVHVFMASVQDQPPRLMIGVLVDGELTPEQMHPAFEAIGKAAHEARGDTDAFDMMPLHAGMIEAIRPVEGIVYSRAQEI